MLQLLYAASAAATACIAFQCAALSVGITALGVPSYRTLTIICVFSTACFLKDVLEGRNYGR